MQKFRPVLRRCYFLLQFLDRTSQEKTRLASCQSIHAAEARCATSLRCCSIVSRSLRPRFTGASVRSNSCQLSGRRQDRAWESKGVRERESRDGSRGEKNRRKEGRKGNCYRTVCYGLGCWQSSASTRLRHSRSNISSHCWSRSSPAFRTCLMAGSVQNTCKLWKSSECLLTFFLPDEPGPHCFSKTRTPERAICSWYKYFTILVGGRH